MIVVLKLIPVVRVLVLFLLENVSLIVTLSLLSARDLFWFPLLSVTLILKWLEMSCLVLYFLKYY